jgi:hypothetical protein
MSGFSENLSALLEFSKAPNTSKKSIALYNALNSSYKKDPKSAETQRLLGEYTKSIGDDFADACGDFIEGDTFKGLSNSAKAEVIREIMGSGLTVGFDKTAQVSFEVYSKILKKHGHSAGAAKGVIDEKRLREVIKIAIGDSLDEEYAQTSSFVRGTFRQIVATGNRETVLATGEQARKNGARMIGIRRSSGGNSCDYCKERDGVAIELGGEDAQSLYSYHDFCRCSLEIKVI